MRSPPCVWTLEPRCGHYLWDTQDAAASWDAKMGGGPPEGLLKHTQYEYVRTSHKLTDWGN